MNNISIRLKLILSIGTLAFGYLLFLGLVTWSGANMQRHLRLASDSLFPAALAGQQADAGFQKMIKDYKDAVLTQDVKTLNIADEDGQKIAAQLQIVREKTVQNSELQQQVASVQDQFKDISSQSKATYTKMIATPDAMDDQLMATVKNLAGENANLATSLKDLNETIGKKDFQFELEAVGKATNLQRLMTIILFAVAVAFALFTTIVLQRQIAAPLKRAVEVLRLVASGDLTATLDIDRKDEVGNMAEALNDALGKLRATLQEVTETAAKASLSSKQLETAAEAIASGSQEQAASLEETSASLEEITATVRQSADNARQANQLAAASKDSAEGGQAVVTTAVAAMEEINVASAKISDIISTIDQIAFQTNLLAVNAAVEAARAGEQGRGFAVVAAEVRSLALRSAGAAKEIKNLIQDSLRKVERGSKLVHQSGETLRGIVGSVRTVTDIVGDIASASAEQSTGIEQVNTAMMQMDRVTQANSAQTEELYSTARSLSEHSERLTSLVGTFILKKESEATERRPFSVRKAVSNSNSPMMDVKVVAAEERGREPGFYTGVRNESRAKRIWNSPEPVAIAGKDEADHSFEEF
jgi:methyl-accepting chemotaxis protein